MPRQLTQRAERARERGITRRRAGRPPPRASRARSRRSRSPRGSATHDGADAPRRARPRRATTITTATMRARRPAPPASATRRGIETPSRIAASGGTRVARIAGTGPASDRHDDAREPARPRPCASRATVPLSGRSAPNDLNSWSSAGREREPGQQPERPRRRRRAAGLRRRPCASAAARDAPSVRSRPNSRVRWATVIENVLKMMNAPTNSDDVGEDQQERAQEAEVAFEVGGLLGGLLRRRCGRPASRGSDGAGCARAARRARRPRPPRRRSRRSARPRRRRAAPRQRQQRDARAAEDAPPRELDDARRSCSVGGASSPATTQRLARAQMVALRGRLVDRDLVRRPSGSAR